jgi:RHS repeat-associated protein
VAARYDYLPFGEEIPKGVAGRTPQMGYGGSDATRQKFTSYERDVESGLEFAQARYFSSAMGRFTSTDPLLASGNPTDPQSWNRYTYSANNPLTFVDPNGLLWFRHKDNPRQPVWLDYIPKKNEGYEDIDSHVYWGGEKQGYVALDMNANRWKVGLSSKEEAEAVRNALTQETLDRIDGGANYNILDSASEVGILMGVGGLAKGVVQATVSASFRTGYGQAVCWTGGEEAKNIAAGFAKEFGKSTFANTKGGRVLNYLDGTLPSIVAQPLFRLSSTVFAKEASGPVIAFVRGLRDNSSIYFKHELPALMRNPNVTTVVQRSVYNCHKK